jgi:hypothetical protein
MCSGPLKGKYRCFEELFVGVFLADILLLEIVLGQLVDEEFMSRNEVFFSEARIENKCFILKEAIR